MRVGFTTVFGRYFDVPEAQKRAREILRAKLRLLGFAPVQKSVWITRTDVRSSLRRWLALRQLTPYAKLLLVKEFEK